MRTAEQRDPGFTEEFIETVACDRARMAVVRLRGPRLAEDVRRIAEQAEAWCNGAALVIDASRRRKKRA